MTACSELVPPIRTLQDNFIDRFRKYIRPNVPQEQDSDILFINSVGKKMSSTQINRLMLDMQQSIGYTGVPPRASENLQNPWPWKVIKSHYMQRPPPYHTRKMSLIGITGWTSIQHERQKCKIQKNWCTVTVAPTIEHHGGHSWTPADQRWD